MRLLSGSDDLEHLLLTDTLDLRQGHRKLGSLLISLLLNRTRQSFSIGSLRTVEQVVGQWRRRRFLRSRRLDVLLLLRTDALLHLDLLCMALLLVELGSQSAEILGILRLLVGFTGDALSGAFLVVEAIYLVRLQFAISI